MFDRSLAIIQPRVTEYVDRHVTVKRAPTDESVTLLREMESAARAQVDNSVSVGDNGFEGVIHTWRDMLSDTTIHRCLFALNGRKMDVKVELRSFDYDHGKAIDALRAAIADKISVEILASALGRTFS
jgi:hypothetical protein